jgi:hypothetical protein
LKYENETNLFTYVSIGNNISVMGFLLRFYINAMNVRQPKFPPKNQINSIEINNFSGQHLKKTTTRISIYYFRGQI